MQIPRAPSLNVPLSALAVVVLTDQFAYWSMRAPASVSACLIDTYPWRVLHDVVASTRLVVGASGPEQDDLLLLQCQVVLSFLLALLAVWFVKGRLVATLRPKPGLDPAEGPAR